MKEAGGNTQSVFEVRTLILRSSSSSSSVVLAVSSRSMSSSTHVVPQEALDGLVHLGSDVCTSDLAQSHHENQADCFPYWRNHCITNCNNPVRVASSSPESVRACPVSRLRFPFGEVGDRRWMLSQQLCVFCPEVGPELFDSSMKPTFISR